jgi:RNA polymerase sigma-70 factor (ECF subfamily)
MSPPIQFAAAAAGMAPPGASAAAPCATGTDWRYLRKQPTRRRLQEPSTAADRLPDEPDQGTAADHRLIQAFLRREPGSDQLIADRLQVVPRMLGSLCRRLGFPLPSQDLEDIAQDATMIALRKLDQIKPQVPLDAWLNRLCNFELSNALRRRRRQRSEPLPDDVADRTERALQQLERSEVLLAGLEQLRPLDAAIVRLHQLEGLTLEATSRRLAITENAAKGRYYRAIEQLTEILRRHRPGKEEP